MLQAQREKDRQLHSLVISCEQQVSLLEPIPGSPHISSIRERIVVGKTGSPISAESLRDLLRGARGILDCAIIKEFGRLSHFEVLTALAFKHFAEEKVDIAVVETGLGGARDATNVVKPNGLATAVIVAIGEEHLQALGGSLESIALAKAGIIKPGCPVVLGHQSEPIAEAVVYKVAASKRAPVFTTSSKDVQFSFNGYYIEKGVPFQVCSFVIDSKIEGLRVDLSNCKLRMIGPHQLDNATTAILTAICLRRKGWQIKDTAIQNGIECTFLPGRFQLTTSVEARALGACDAHVILDGAHTAGSAIMLAKTLKSFFQYVPLALVVAMASDKDHSAFASAMLSECKPAIIVTTEVSVAGSRLRSASKSFLLRTWKEAAKRHEMAISHHSESLPNREHEVCKEDALLYDLKTDVERRDQEKQVASQALKATKHGRAALVLEQADSLAGAIKLASERLQQFQNLGQGIICVTGSLHAVSAANAIISDCAKH